jgi:hypothetical protein
MALTPAGPIDDVEDDAPEAALEQTVAFRSHLLGGVSVEHAGAAHADPVTLGFDLDRSGPGRDAAPALGRNAIQAGVDMDDHEAPFV